MFDYIKGTITSIKGNYIVLESNQIGYLIKTANPFKYEINSSVKVYIYMYIREDVLDLYGFQSSDEKELFLQLISVKGLGPKGALAIISSESIEKVIFAINNGDNKYLQRFPGIGPKASQQIILDLHGKINFNNNIESSNPKVNYIVEALKAMGYKPSEIKSVSKIIEDNLDQDTSVLIKTVLKSLSK